MRVGKDGGEGSGAESPESGGGDEGEADLADGEAALADHFAGLKCVGPSFDGVAGAAVFAGIEGSRPMLVEIQALVVPTQLVVPRRIGQGVDYQRLQLITAVLTKKLNLPLAGFDIYVNVTGGLKVEEPAVDLGVALAIISSFKNLALREKTVCFGELGLLGEVRPVSQMDKRKKEARRLGFTTIISPEKYSSIAQVFKQFFK